MRIPIMILTMLLALTGCGIFEREAIPVPQVEHEPILDLTFFVRVDGDTVIDSVDGSSVEVQPDGADRLSVQFMHDGSFVYSHTVIFSLPRDVISGRYDLIDMADRTPNGREIGASYLFSWVGATPMYNEETYADSIDGVLVLDVNAGQISGSFEFSATGNRVLDGGVPLEERTVQIDGAFLGVPLADLQ